MPQADNDKRQLPLIIVLVLGFLLGTYLLITVSPHSPETEQVQAPLATLETILNVKEVKVKAAEAYSQNNTLLFNALQRDILDTATQLLLSEADLARIQDDTFIDYLSFIGQRYLYQQTEERAYWARLPANTVFAQHPNLSVLFDDTERLFAQRDQLIAQIKHQLKQEHPFASGQEIEQRVDAYWSQRAQDGLKQ